MSLEMYEKLKLKNLDSTSIPHVVGASGESLGARGKTKCKININGKIFYQTFIVCEHLKRPIILGRDFSTQNCIGISWTKTNTRRLTQNNEVIAETAEYQTPSRAWVSLKKNIKVPPQSCAVVALFLKRVIKNVRSHDFYSPFYSFLASRYLFRVAIWVFFLGFTFFTLLIFLNYNSLTHF